MKIIRTFFSEFTKYDSIKSDWPSDKTRMVLHELFSNLSETWGDSICNEILQAPRQYCLLPKYTNL